MSSKFLEPYVTSPSTLLFVGLFFFGVYHATRAVYLLYLSPLAQFPGSKWAALGE